MKKRKKVYLNTKNLKYKKKSKKRNRKLNHVKIELFFIKKIKKTINYELNLFKNVKIYSIFHVSFLKSIDFNIFIQKTFYYATQKKKRIRNKKFFETIKSIIFCQMKKLLIIEKYLRIVQTCKKLSKTKEIFLKKKFKSINQRYS